MATATRDVINGEPHDAALEPEKQVVWLAPDQIVPWPGLNPRKHFDPTKHAELVASIREHGILQPVLVAPPLDGTTGVHWLILGERRWRAATEAGAWIPAFIRDLDRVEALKLAVVENLQRDDIDVIEEAFGFKQLVELGVSQHEIAHTVGKSQEHISNRIRLTQLPDDVAELVASGRLLHTHARDYFLPFINIPEKKRKELFKRALHDLDHKPQRKGNEPYRGEEVADVIGRVARDLSKPTSGTDRWTVVFAPGLHEQECKCNGPKFKFDHYSPAKVRCFDDEWWQKAQDAARRAKKKQLEGKRAKAEKTADAGGASRVLSQAEFSKKYGYRYNSSIDAADAFDVSLLEGCEFVVVDGYNGKEVRCTAQSKLDAARAAAQDELSTILAGVRERRKLADVEAVYKTKLTGATVRALLVADVSLSTLMKEFGFDVGHRDAEKVASKLTDAQAELIAKVVALRVKRGEYNNRRDDPAEAEARKQLRDKYGAEVTRLRRKVLASSGSNKAKKTRGAAS